MDKADLEEWVEFLTKPVSKISKNPSNKICSSSVDQDIEQWKAKINKDQEKENA